MEIIKDEKMPTEIYHTCERCGFDRIKHDHKFCGICGLPQKKDQPGRPSQLVGLEKYIKVILPY